MKKIVELRKWQIEALNAGRHAQKFICQAPGGSGKSLVQLMLAQADIEDSGNKQLILVPQNHIHHSFFDEECIEFRLPWHDEPSRWIVANNLCEGTDVIDRLRTFLLADAKDLARAGTLAAISTHRAMVAAWKTLNADERNTALRNISVRIDEAHHISNAFHDADLALYNVKDRESIVTDATRLGGVVRVALRCGNPTVKFHLTTATFFRGDRKTILSKAFRTEFTHFELPWDEYFPYLGLKLAFDFVTYDGSPLEQVIAAIAAEPNEKHLVIIPALTCRFRTPKSLASLMMGLAQVYPADRILDLVTPETQAQHKSHLFAHPEAFDVVVACRLFDEGADWPPCTRLHNTDAGERSLTLAVQRFFRPLRQHPRKSDVRIDNYIPAFDSSMTLTEQREVLSDRFNAVLTAIVTQGELMPIFVPIKGKAIAGKLHSKKTTRLQDVYGDAYHSLLEDLLSGYEKLVEKSVKAVESMVEETVERFGIPDNVEAEDAKAACLAQVLRYAASHAKASDRHTLEIKAFEVADIRKRGFDVIWSKCPRGSALVWGTGDVSASIIRELLTVVKPVPSLDEIAEAVKTNYQRTGTRIQVSDSSRNGWFDELNRSIQSVDHICRRYFGTSLAKVITAAIGKPQDSLLQRAREVIGQYFRRNVVLTRATEYIPEIGMSGETLDNRLRWHHNTTIRKELERLFGKQRTPLSLAKVRAVIAKYRRRGTSLLRRHFYIPELDMTNSNLRSRLKNDFDFDLATLVAEESSNAVMGEGDGHE